MAKFFQNDLPPVSVWRSMAAWMSARARKHAGVWHKLCCCCYVVLKFELLQTWWISVKVVLHCEVDGCIINNLLLEEENIIAEVNGQRGFLQGGWSKREDDKSPLSSQHQFYCPSSWYTFVRRYHHHYHRHGSMALMDPAICCWWSFDGHGSVDFMFTVCTLFVVDFNVLLTVQCHIFVFAVSLELSLDLNLLPYSWFDDWTRCFCGAFTVDLHMVLLA